MSTKRTNSRVKLTKTVIEKIDPPESGQVIVRDSELIGFAVRVIPSGRKTFVIEKRIHGKVKRYKLARYPDLTVAEARKQAQFQLGQIAIGEDPPAKRRRERARRITLIEAYEDFLKARPRLRPSTRKDYDRAMYKVFSDWSRRPLHKLTGAMMLKRHRDLAQERSEHAANNYMRVLRAVITFAMDCYEDGSGRPLITHNPVLVLTRTRSWFPPKRRQTWIKAGQLATWYKAVESLRDNDHHRAMGDTVADCLLLAVFTGLRRGEVTQLKWRHVELKDSSLKIPTTKSHRTHTLPFGKFIHTLLVRRLGTQQNQYVFAGYEGKGHLTEPKRQIEHVVQESGIPFSMHDLRRTFLTVADTLELSPYTIKRLANHSTKGDVTAGYIMSDLDRLRKPMERVESFLLSAMGIDSTAQIIPLPIKKTGGRDAGVNEDE